MRTKQEIPEGYWECSNERLHKNGETCHLNDCLNMPGSIKDRFTHDPVLAVIEENFALEALDDFLIVQEDKFRTGYECKTCDGEGHTAETCKKCNGTKLEKISNVCQNCAGTGYVADLFREIGEPVDIVKRKKCRECRDGKVDIGKLEEGLYPCRACIASLDASGRVGSTGFEQCKDCKGRGVALVVPEDTMRRPNSGIIVSIGPKVSRVKCGERVMYSNHTGYEIFFKRSLKFRQMREHEVMSRIHGVKKLHQVLE